MRKRHFFFKWKNKKKNPEKTNENDNLPDKELKALVIRMLTELGKRIDEHSKNFNKEVEM